MQATLPDHLHGIVVPEVPIQRQITDRDPISQHGELFFEHFLDPLQFWGQLNLGFVPVPAAFGTSALLLWCGFILLRALLLALFGRYLLCLRANDLLRLQWIGAPFFDRDQRQREDGDALHHFVQQAGEEVVQTMRLFARFGHHTFISHQKVFCTGQEQVPHEETQEDLRPADRSIEKTLHRPVAAAFPGPAGKSQHRHTTAHAQHRLGDPAQTSQIGV